MVRTLLVFLIRAAERSFYLCRQFALLHPGIDRQALPLRVCSNIREQSGGIFMEVKKSGRRSVEDAALPLGQPFLLAEPT